jgi:hypothetical protein
LEYLGFSSKIIAATARLTSSGSGAVEYVGVHDRPSLREDGSTDGHAVLWAESFQRLVDPTIFLARLMQESAEYRAIYQPLAIFEIPDEGIIARGSLIQTSTKAGIDIRWRLHPQWSEFIVPVPGGDLEGGLAYGQLALAYITLEVMRGLEELRSDLDDLRDLYPPLAELLDNRRRLPELPDEPRRSSHSFG